MRRHKFGQETEQQASAAKEHTSPWKLGGLAPWQLLKRVYHEISDDDVGEKAA
ncbi:MAG TPA: hypothetical protein VH724_17550 [Candidatus Angelobacter sp.]|nr:hypothetical protein [Candidatus Angelobacter sp.]